MKYVLAGAFLVASAVSASAISLNYYGQYYTEASGSGPAYAKGFGEYGAGYVFPSGYDKGMRIELSFELAEPLAADTEFDFYLSDFLSYSFSDGLYERTPEDPGFLGIDFIGQLQTNEFGNVSDWYISIHNGSAADSDFFGTSSADGDRATHSREYLTFGDDMNVTGVFSEASVGTSGVWFYDDNPASLPLPAPVPLPAALPLVLSGFGLFGLLRRRQRRG